MDYSILKEVEAVSGYISKERAEICVMSAIEGSEGDDVLRALDDVRLAINSEPAANVAPVINAHWIHLGGGLAKCSNCKWIFKDVYDQDNEDTFCRKCGAKMDEEEQK